MPGKFSSPYSHTAIKILRLTCIARYPPNLVTTWMTCLLKLPRLWITECFVWLPFYVRISVEWLALCEKHNNINNTIKELSLSFPSNSLIWYTLFPSKPVVGWLVGVVNSYINRVQLPTCCLLSLNLSAWPLCYMLLISKFSHRRGGFIKTIEAKPCRIWQLISISLPSYLLNIDKKKCSLLKGGGEFCFHLELLHFQIAISVL